MIQKLLQQELQTAQHMSILTNREEQSVDFIDADLFTARFIDGGNRAQVLETRFVATQSPVATQSLTSGLRFVC